jgi:hypothetical protein
VSQALERMRQAARQRKEEQFTALLHHISTDLPQEAYEAYSSGSKPRLAWMAYFQQHGSSRPEAHSQAIALIGQTLINQTAFLAYIDVFGALALLALLLVPRLVPSAEGRPEVGRANRGAVALVGHASVWNQSRHRERSEAIQDEGQRRDSESPRVPRAQTRGSSR